MKTMNATQAKNNFGLFIETLMMDGGIVITKHGRRIAVCRTTEDELLLREKAKKEATKWLSHSLKSPVSPGSEQATADELMTLLEMSEPEARELFSEKFGE